MLVFDRGGAGMASVLFAVRAEVPEAERARFDHWYETDHLPWAKREFGARRAWRCWSRSDPGVHVAFYEFDSLAAAEAATSSEKVKPLVADFDRVWGDRVPRRRAILEIVQEIASSRQPNSSAARETAIDRDDCAGHIVGEIGREKLDDLGAILDR